MVLSKPYFWAQPIKYLRWSSHEKPALFWSCIIGAIGPISMVVVPPIREYYGDKRRPRIPLTYPIPAGPRRIPEGYDD
ncbi:hypothetical protein FKW77_008411 [Venturia effusa]|uniref:NADH-ubiquinone oxidoreductase 9.5 kDa subunit n=1 Tax=Venturia effusa TaxID=50376 RepID=A0A517L1T3_9PEZI|nr:hypothetical protein FKW77_008411 [Venturia effusa]